MLNRRNRWLLAWPLIAACGHAVYVTEQRPRVVAHDERLSAVTASGLPVNVDLTVTDHVEAAPSSQPEHLAYATVVLPAVRSSLRQRIAAFDPVKAQDADREDLAHLIRDDVRHALAGHGVGLDSLVFHRVSLPPELQTVVDEQARIKHEQQTLLEEVRAAEERQQQLRHQMDELQQGQQPP